MSNPKRADRRDVSELWMLLVLALLGLIPWAPTLFGEPPAFSAEVGATVALGAACLLLTALRDLWGSRHELAPADADETPPTTRDGQPLH